MKLNSFSPMPEDDEELHLPELVYWASLGGLAEVEQLLASGSDANSADEEGYSALQAASIISANAVAGIAGTFFSGIVSDRFCGGSRHLPALLFGLLYIGATALFVGRRGDGERRESAHDLYRQQGRSAGAALGRIGGVARSAHDQPASAS